MHRSDRGVNLGQNRRKCKKFLKKIFFWVKFLKMLNGGPGPGQANGTVFGPQIESRHIEFIFFKNRGHFPGSSITKSDKDDP